MLDSVPRELSEEDRAAAASRRARLVAALADQKVTQAELHRRLAVRGERIAPTTINRWCTGKTPISELTLIGIFAVLGLPLDWDPRGATTVAPKKKSTTTRKPH